MAMAARPVTASGGNSRRRPGVGRHLLRSISAGLFRAVTEPYGTSIAATAKATIYSCRRSCAQCRYRRYVWHYRRRPETVGLRRRSGSDPRRPLDRRNETPGFVQANKMGSFTSGPQDRSAVSATTSASHLGEQHRPEDRRPIGILASGDQELSKSVPQLPGALGAHNWQSMAFSRRPGWSTFRRTKSGWCSPVTTTEFKLIPGYWALKSFPEHARREGLLLAWDR